VDQRDHHRDVERRAEGAHAEAADRPELAQALERRPPRWREHRRGVPELLKIGEGQSHWGRILA
jgi:hypothetical protein